MSTLPVPARVLFLSGLQIHPTYSGGTLRSYGLVSALHGHGLDVFVYSLVGRKADYLARRRSSTETWPAGVEEHVDRRASSFVVQYGSYGLDLPPLWIPAYLRAAARAGGRPLPRLLRERLGWCDVVVADSPYLYPAFDAAGARGTVCVLNTHNVEHHVWAEGAPWPRRWIRPAVRRLELAAAERCDVLVACSSHDQRYFESAARVKRSVLVPNGIDPGRFAGIAGLRGPTRAALGLADDVRAFLFTGSKWGPNREAADFLLDFARQNGRLLEENRLHLLLVGSVTEPVRLPGLTATGRVDAVEPYFAAADAGLNPLSSGAGTNVKMGEFMAARLPILSTGFGARGYAFEDGRTGFLFEKDALAPALLRVRDRLDGDPGGLRRMADEAFAHNESAIDMNAAARVLVDAIAVERAERTRGAA